MAEQKNVSNVAYDGTKPELKGLSHTAYGGIKGEDYVPYVPVSKALPELTVLSIIIGCLLAMVFAAANTYLGLKIGTTVSAGIPAAILATTIYKSVLKKNNILEANMVQSMAAMGETLAAGLIYTVPAVLIIGMKLTLPMIATAGLLGGLLGILFIVPIRKYLLVEEHGNLVFPESMAIAEVLVSSTEGGSGFKTMMVGLGFGGVYKIITEGFYALNFEAEWTLKSFQKTIFGVDVMGSLIGVGFIVGLDISLYMVAGAVIAYFGFIPLITYIGSVSNVALFPSTVPIAEMSAAAIRSSYVRYIGAGAVAMGGFIGVVKTMPTIVKSFKSAMSGFGEKGGSSKTDKDVPMSWVLAGAIFVFILAWILPIVKVGVVGAFMVVLMSFFFSVVSARLVGVIGNTNNPISGMTIAGLLATTAALKATGAVGDTGMLAALIAGTMICVAISISGGAAQSLKTTWVIGGTPKYVEIGMYFATIASAAVVGAVILLLHSQYGMGSDQVGAPQANLMAILVKGVMTAQLPWVLLAIGAAIAVMLELMHIPILAVALGIYLPIHLSVGILIGGIIRALVEKRLGKKAELLKAKVENGILLSSGLVAGDALFGIIIALFAMLNIDIAFGPKVLPEFISNNPWATAVVGLLFAVWVYRFVMKPEKDDPINEGTAA